ncbi:two-component system sensor histidine kinase YesM [Fontibacillus phaseoli]|uniref:histidine kinase n=1 Tax=Fontibacillus phaseoli TaxID=1416533 RepID=A0A369B9X3_9BACL|nr:histidine kinase [Fontibacillus phaseoli]RCX18201.1 two-component system sensor histidine kinase YesM [Fontibacillus phaseoli]
MIVGGIYRKYFKNNLFMKIILFFSMIMILTIITFSYLMYQVMSEAAVQRQMDVQKSAIESVSNYISGKYESVQRMLRDVYRDRELAYNTSYFMEHPYQDYVKYRLDRFFNDTGSTTDTVQYFRNQVEDDRDIMSLMLYSADMQQLYAYNSFKQFKIIPTNASRSYVPDAMYLEEEAGVSLPNIWIRKTIGMPETPVYSVRVPVNNNQSLRNMGQLVVYFDTNRVQDTLERFRDNLKGQILVISSKGDVLFDSSGTYYGRKYPHFDQVNSVYDNGTIGGDLIVTKLMQNQGSFTVLSTVPKNELAKTYRGLRNTILTISAICILVAIILPSLFISNFAKRTYGIVRFTRKVRNGDLSVRIEDDRDDELGLISKSFNSVLDNLNVYINRVYKAEIKQKQSELKALESRVNPHFLYNTLEVIRMRAVSQGANDVGEMIYSLSMLFKNYVQQKRNYTLKDELEACRMYLELFRIRYKDRLAYEIHYDKGLDTRPVMKMSLQPIIENYIIHGLRTDRADNIVSISVVSSDGGMLQAKVEDNGRGIPPDRLEEINQGLQKPDEYSESFGLRSIHERLKLLYGDAYGVEVRSEEGKGTTVVVTFPELEEGDRNV